MDNTESRKRPASEMNDKDENSNKRPHIPERRETTIFGIKPVDDIVQYVADFIATHCDQENVEVSAHSSSPIQHVALLWMLTFCTLHRSKESWAC